MWLGLSCVGDCTVFSVVLLSAGVLGTGVACDLSSGRMQLLGGRSVSVAAGGGGSHCSREHLTRRGGEGYNGLEGRKETGSICMFARAASGRRSAR